jgi:hypothetical protein
MNSALIVNSPLFDLNSFMIGNALSITLHVNIDYSTASEKAFITQMIAEAPDPTNVTTIIVHALVKEITGRNMIVAYVDIPSDITSETPVAVDLQELSIESYIAGIYDLEVLESATTV